MGLPLGKHCGPRHSFRGESRRVAPELPAFPHRSIAGRDFRYVRGFGGADPDTFVGGMVLVSGEYGHVWTTASAVRRAQPGDYISSITAETTANAAEK